MLVILNLNGLNTGLVKDFKARHLTYYTTNNHFIVCILFIGLEQLLQTTSGKYCVGDEVSNIKQERKDRKNICLFSITLSYLLAFLLTNYSFNAIKFTPFSFLDNNGRSSSGATSL